MDFKTHDDESFLDLSLYSTKDCCLWLLNKLDVETHKKNFYTNPFCNYVLTWHRAVPLTCIIIGQSPYSDNIFPHTAAAMSYSEDMMLLSPTRKAKKSIIPDTVEVLANDLYVNAGMNKIDCINIIKDGWKLIDFGVLLVNERVYSQSSSSNYYQESVDQANVIIRLLKETEKYGKRTVDIYAMGEAGQRMASNICSWYKSGTIKLSKHAVKHPASISRRFDDYSNRNCHMETPSFSKSLARHLCNYVAPLHNMPKKSEEELKIQKHLDLLKSATEAFATTEQAQNIFNSCVQDMNKEFNNDDDLKAMLERLYNAGDTLAFRFRMTASVTSQIQRSGEQISGNISRSGPSLSQPSASSISSHPASQDTPKQISRSKAVPLNFNKNKKKDSNIEDSSYSKVSPPSSTRSLSTTGTSAVVLNLNKSPKTISGTPIKLNINKKDSTPNNDSKEDNTKSSLGARFRNQNIIQSSNKSEDVGKKENQEMVESNNISVRQKNELASVEAVVISYKENADEDPQCSEIFELIQNDIKYMTMYNDCVKDLVNAIDKDIKNIPKFDFSQWVQKNMESCETLEVCKELFDF